MSFNNKDFESKYDKTDDLWPIGVDLVEHEIATGMWVTTQWQLTGFQLTANEGTPDVCLLHMTRSGG